MSGILKIYHRIIPGEIKKTEEPLPEQFLNNHVKAGYYPGFAVYLSYTALCPPEVIFSLYSAPRISHKWGKPDIWTP